MMNPEEFRALMSEGALTRRQITKLLASLGILTVSIPALHRPASAADVLLQVFTWANYDRPEQHKVFTAKYGRSPDFAVLAENDEARAKVRGGFRPDIAMPSESHAPFWIKDGLVGPVDVSRLSHWPELFDRMRKIETSMGPNGEHYFVPWTWGNNSVVFRTDLAPEYVNNPTWTILWDPKFKGRIALRDAYLATTIPAALVLGAKDPYNMTDKELAGVADLLRKQRELVRFYWKAETEAQQALAAGEIVAMFAWNSSYAALKKQGIPVGFMVPKEGMPTWVDGHMLIKGGPAPEQQKYDFIDATLAPEVGVYNIEQLNYGSSNRKSFQMADRRVLALLGLEDPDAIMTKGLWSKAVPPATYRKMLDLHNRVKSGF
ncbi:MAG: extracellular solute-binding protein [Candidatus Rokubacteria bacterium]|nr:extracellular solute-binding protein [Candidatus Rokubacteria bacterium]